MDGQQKKRLSEKLQQTKSEVELETKAAMQRLNSSLIELANTELTTTQGVIRTQSAEIQTLLTQQQALLKTHRQIAFKPWINTLAMSLILSIFMGGLLWMLVLLMDTQIQWRMEKLGELSTEIAQAKEELTTTEKALASFPKGVSYQKTTNGQKFIVSTTRLGESFQVQDKNHPLYKKWVVEIK